MSEGIPLDRVRALRAALGGNIFTTPLLRCRALEALLGHRTRIFGKLEFLQRTGTFKARGALSVLRSLDATQRRAGVTAVSAGNHAIATAYAAQVMKTSAKVVMTATASPARMSACRRYGAEIVLADNVHHAFELAEQIRDSEGRFLVQPFEGPDIATGTGTLALEICEQCGDFDAIVVPVGGGGLLAGIANVVRKMRPASTIVGVEPTGADTMHRSFAAGEPRAIESVRTIADSLGAPFAMPYSFSLCRRYVNHLTLVDDLQLRRAMGVLFQTMKFAVEPACAATTAALLGPLREELADKTVVLVFCGSNIDWDTYARQAIFESDRAS